MLGVDHAAHVLPEDRVVGELHALRARFRAARVDDLRDVEAVGPVARRLAALFDQRERVRHALDRRRLVLGGQPQQLASTPGAAAAALRATAAMPLSSASMRAPAVLEDEGDVVRLQHEVDRHHDGAEAHQRVAQRDEAVGVAREHGDPVAPPDPAAREPCRQPLASGVEFAVGPARRPAGETEPVRNALRAAAQRVGERLAPDGRVHGSSLTRAASGACAKVGRTGTAVNRRGAPRRHARRLGRGGNPTRSPPADAPRQERAGGCEALRRHAWPRPG